MISWFKDGWMNYDDLKGRSDEVRAGARKEREAQAAASKRKAGITAKQVKLSDIKTPDDLAKIVQSRVESAYGPTNSKGQTFHDTNASYDRGTERRGLSRVSIGVARWSGDIHFTPRVKQNIERFLSTGPQYIWDWANTEDRIKYKMFISNLRVVFHENIHLVGRGPMSKVDYQNAVGQFFEEGTTEYLARKQTVKFLREPGVLDGLSEAFKKDIDQILDETGAYGDYVNKIRDLITLLPGDDKDLVLAAIKLRGGESKHVMEWVRELLPKELSSADKVVYEHKMYMYLESYALGGTIEIDDIRKLIQQANQSVKPS